MREAKGMAHAMKRFHRVKGRDHQRAGTGLGLAICLGFVEAMGGTIKAANRADRSGALFNVGLPLASARKEKRETVV